LLESASLPTLVITSAMFCFVVSRVVSGVAALMVPPKGVPAESVWWYIWRMKEKTSVLDVHRHLLEKFGPVYCTWLGTFQINVCDPAANKFFFQRTDLFVKQMAANAPKIPLVSRWLGTKSILMVEGDEWKRQSRLMKPAFGAETLRAVAPLFMESVDAYAKRYDTSGEASFFDLDVHQAMTKFTIDVLGLAAFGTEFKLMSDDPAPIAGLYEKLRAGINKPVAVMVNYASGCGLWDRLPLESNAEYRRDTDAFRGMLRDVVSAKRAVRREEDSKSHGLNETDVKKDLVHLMVEGEESLTDEEFIDNLAIFFLAGHDTTTTSLTMAALLLAEHAAVQDKAREEVLAAIAASGVSAEAAASPKASVVNYEAQKNMPFLTNVLKETLRLFPPATSIPPRRALADCDIPLSDGSTVPVKKGARVTCAVYASHVNPDNFEDPLAFNPSRFDDPVPPFAFVPFGGASRVCIGQHFSLMEQRIFLAEMLRRYTLLPLTSVQRAYDTFKGPSLLLQPDHAQVRFEKRLL